MAEFTRTYGNFSGGQNNHAGIQASPIILDGGGVEALMFAHEAQNYEMAENGLIKYAGDAEVITSPAAAVTTGEFDWNGEHILCKGGKVYTVSGTSETEIYTGHTAGKYYQFTPWEDGAGNEILIMCNGTDTPLYYDGTTCTTITFIDPDGIWNNAKPQGCAPFRGSIEYWGDPVKKSRVYIPIPGSYNDFTNTDGTAGAFDVDAGFGGPITGMKALTSNLMVIYKRDAIRRQSGINPFGSTVDPISLEPITDEYGCIAPRSIVQKGLDQYFLAEDGYRKLKPIQAYGDVEDQSPTYPIQGIFDELNYDPDAIGNACAVFHKPSKQIWLAVPTGASTTNNLIIIHDVITGGNDPRAADDINASVLATFGRKVYHGDYEGQIYKHGDDYNYHGTAVDAQWESKWIANISLAHEKIYRELWIYVESDGAGSLICQTAVLQMEEETAFSTTEEISSGENAWDDAQWDTAVWATGSQGIFKITDLGRGNALKLRFINNANNQRIKIRMVELHFDITGTSRG